jgi:ABC-type Mn2+/Zn2+ transport system permease subunit
MAEASGVRGGLVHYLMMGLLAITIIAGIRIAGSVLVTALLVLPGATALLLSSRLKTVIVISVALGLVSAVGGVAVSARWRYLPAGPMMVLILFAIFFVVFCVTKSRPAPARV